MKVAAALVTAATGIASSAAVQQNRPEVLPVTPVPGETGGYGTVDFTPETITMRFEKYYEHLTGAVPARGKVTSANANTRLEPKPGYEGWRFRTGKGSYAWSISSTNQTYVTSWGRLMVRYISAPQPKSAALTVRTQYTEYTPAGYFPVSNSESVVYTGAAEPRYTLGSRTGWGPCTGAAGWAEGSKVFLSLSQQITLQDPYGKMPEGTPWSISVGKPDGKSDLVARFEVEWERCSPEENPMDKWGY